MKTNPIIEHLRAIAQLGWNERQKAYYEQRAKDARPVECVPMREVFTPEQLRLLANWGYKAQRKMCYRNAAELVRLIAGLGAFTLAREPVKYVEGFAYAAGLLPIEHAFVKVGDKYVDPTFERALHRDVRKECYVVLIELDPETMAKYQSEIGFYGELYQYAWMLEHRPDLAAAMRERNPSKNHPD